MDAAPQALSLTETAPGVFHAAHGYPSLGEVTPSVETGVGAGGGVGGVLMNRVWAMPSADTFDVPPIAGFVKKYLMRSKVSIDPFARNKRWVTYTNDLNPETAAKEHMDAEDFLRKYRNICPDLVIFDPPYSPGQVSEVYQKVGEKRDGGGGRNAELYARVRRAIREMAVPGTVVLSFGWQSAGMGKGWELMELLIVCHGGAHNDTICMAERLKTPDAELFGLAGGGGWGGSETPTTEAKDNDPSSATESAREGGSDVR